LSSSTPLVSVCIPCYNSGKYIGKTITCLLNQTYKNIEIIVVDDGSEDETQSILKSIQDKRFKYIIQPNKGASAARNAAFKLSTGGFIKFMDADDLINNACIQNQLAQIIEKPDCIASAKWGRFYTNDASDFKLAPEKIYRDLSGIDWLVNSLIDSGANMMQPGIFLMPRNIIETAGQWNEELSLIDDFEYMVRVISSCLYVLFCEEAVLMYRSGISNNLSGKKSRKHMKSAFIALNLGIERILEIKNDSRSRLACANTYQMWAYQFYPYHRELCNKTEQQIIKLGGSNISLGGGKMYILLTKLIGWKKAKKLKMLLTGNT
jgi:glycosyltransferase involved in cell wall biosynthesis